MIKVKFKRLQPDAILPRRWSEDSVGYDLHAYAISETGRRNTIMIPPRSTHNVPTGLLIEPPPGHFVMVCSRSGLARQTSVFVANAPGIIDPDYRGEVRVLLYNGGIREHYVQHEDRIAQIVVVPVTLTIMEFVETLSETERGEAGLGSTGT